jgi:hypothetical protein
MDYFRDVVLQQECDAFMICKMLMDQIEKSREVKADEAQMEKERQIK